MFKILKKNIFFLYQKVKYQLNLKYNYLKFLMHFIHPTPTMDIEHELFDILNKLTFLYLSDLPNLVLMLSE